MARVNKVKIAINLIENSIEGVKRRLDTEIANKNYQKAGEHQLVIQTLSQAIEIIKACVGEEK